MTIGCVICTAGVIGGAITRAVNRALA